METIRMHHLSFVYECFRRNSKQVTATIAETIRVTLTLYTQTIAAHFRDIFCIDQAN